LFDAVAAILGIQQKNNFEGQAPMMLEFAAAKSTTIQKYAFEIIDAKQDNITWYIDWIPILNAIVDDMKFEQTEIIARKFHNTFVDINLEIAKKSGMIKIVMSGGSFQNKLLTEGTVDILNENGFLPYWHQRVPPNDGGISLGQIMASQYLNYKED